MKGKIKAGTLGTIQHRITTDHKVRLVYADKFTKDWIWSLDQKASRNLWSSLVHKMMYMYTYCNAERDREQYDAYANNDEVVELIIKMSITDDVCRFTIKLIPSSWKSFYGFS